jgi:acetyl esterase/lipase
LAAWRKLDFSRPPLPNPGWQERTIAGLPGSPDVRIYIVNANPSAAPRPAILHMHGGGFVMRDAKSALHQVQQLAADLDCVVIAVDYRLAPETPFPGALDDNYASLKWLYQNAAQLGVDPSRIAVLGDSAGGGHAAMLAIATRDRGEIPLAYQALIYPMLDDRTGSTRTPAAHVGKVIWSAQDNVFGWSSLLGVPAGSAEVPHGAVPARVENLSGLAPAFIGVGAVDLFVDENIDYARRLMAAGVPTELHVVPGAFHGFDGIETASIARQFRSTLIHALSLALHRDN